MCVCVCWHETVGLEPNEFRGDSMTLGSNGEDTAPTLPLLQLELFTDWLHIGQSCWSGVESEEVYVLVCRNPVGTQWASPSRLCIHRWRTRAFITIGRLW